MKKTIKIFVLVLSLATLFLGCEKDLYEEAIVPSDNQAKVKTVSINEVSFLIPTIQKFNPNYDYLSNDNLNNDVLLRGVEDLNLNLEKIIQNIENNNLESYSISIKNNFSNKEDYYLENLHIVKENNNYKTFIAKYNATDDSKSFDLETFTGKIEIFNIEYERLGIINYENGETLTAVLDEDITNPIVQAKWPVWLLELFGYWNGNPWGNDGNGSDSGEGGSTPQINVHFTNYYPNGTLINVGNTNNPIGNYGGYGNPNSVAVVANNIETWPAEASQSIMANLITGKLSLNSVKRHWLLNSNNIGITSSIYYYMLENFDDDTVDEFANDVIDQMIQNPGVFQSIKPFIIEKQIDDTQLDACTKGILNKLKQNHTIAKVISRFDSPNSVFSLGFNQIPNLVNSDGLPVYGETQHTTNLQYQISLNSNFYNNLGSTHIGKAGTILHEIMHALIQSISLNSNNSTLNGSEDFPTLWNYYVTNVQGQGTLNNNLQHQWLTQYQNVMQQALLEYANETNVTPPTGQTLNQFCYYLSWAGIYTDSGPNGIVIPDSTLPMSDKLKVKFQKQAEMYNETGPNNTIPSNNPSCN